MVFHRGGYGISPYGRASYGNNKSDIEPRFLASIPIDHQTGVHAATVIRFSTYCYSSWIDERTVKVEISEDDGGSYALAYRTAFAPLYDGLHSKLYRADSHTLVFTIHKNENWRAGARIVIRFTGIDEFGQEATKVIPVTWE